MVAVITVGVWQDVVPLGVDPSVDGDKVRDEAGHVALEQGVVAVDDGGTEHVHEVILVHGYRGGRGEIKT